MYFDTFAEFIAMGGHGFYVWLAYGVTMTTLLSLVLWLQLRRKRVISDVRQRAIRQSLANNNQKSGAQVLDGQSLS